MDIPKPANKIWNVLDHMTCDDVIEPPISICLRKGEFVKGRNRSHICPRRERQGFLRISPSFPQFSFDTDYFGLSINEAALLGQKLMLWIACTGNLSASAVCGAR